MKKYTKPKMLIEEIETNEIANTVSGPLVEKGELNTWGDGLVEDFSGLFGGN